MSDYVEELEKQNRELQEKLEVAERAIDEQARIIGNFVFVLCENVTDFVMPDKEIKDRAFSAADRVSLAPYTFESKIKRNITLFNDSFYERYRKINADSMMRKYYKDYHDY